jgi:uncharacterized membrane protein
MKILFRITPFLLLFSFFSFIPRPAFAASDTGWTITDFHSQITINQDTSVNVTETIQVDFNHLQKHGIYRTIPVNYSTTSGNNLNIRFHLSSVTDSQGNSLRVKSTRDGDNLSLRIGDPDRTVTDVQTYVISYRVNQVITQPNNLAELYWNVTGNDWPVPILQASATVTTPQGAILNTICFAGVYGATGQECSHSAQDGTAEFATGYLYPGQGLTISTALDSDLLTFPDFSQRLLWFVTDNWIYASPLLVFAFMFYLWYTRGRDSRYKNIFHEQGDVELVPLFQHLDALTVYGPPQDLSPGEVGVLVDERVHLRDITAVAVDLARRGYFTIKEIPGKGWFKKTDFQLILNKKAESELQDFEKSVLDTLFDEARIPTVKLSKLAKHAYQHLAKAEDQLYQHLSDTGYFIGHPQKIRRQYLGIGIAILIGLFFLAKFVISATGVFGLTNFLPVPGVIFAGVTSGLIIIAFSFFMPARSAKGRKALKEVVGLREWIRLGAWREQIHEKHNFFEEVLPYTIAFGLTSKFISALKDADLKDLTWYQSGRPLSLVYFSSSLNSFGSSIGSGVNASRPKSASHGGSGFGGGGFSGGGFGGGGGGSW